MKRLQPQACMGALRVCRSGMDLNAGLPCMLHFHILRDWIELLDVSTGKRMFFAKLCHGLSANNTCKRPCQRHSPARSARCRLVWALCSFSSLHRRESSRAPQLAETVVRALQRGSHVRPELVPEMNVFVHRLSVACAASACESDL